MTDPLFPTLQKLIDDGNIPDDWLDETIHDEKSAEATGINNDGLEAQLAYLRSNGWTDKIILDLLPHYTEGL